MSKIIEQNTENHAEETFALSDSTAAGDDVCAPQLSADSPGLPSPLPEKATVGLLNELIDRQDCYQSRLWDIMSYSGDLYNS